jgi:large subunit ribosomal protein L4
MASIDVRTASGGTAGTIDLDDALFGIQPNVPVMHQVVTAQLAAARAGTHSTLTRAEVRGGGAKPWRQKGTGRARQGSSRSPHFAGGGVAHGPKPRDYSQRTPKKMVRLALRSALSDRQAGGRVVVVETWDIEPKTRAGVAALKSLALDGKVLVVVAHGEEAAVRAFRNLPDVQLILDRELNAYDVLCNDWLVFSRESLPTATDADRAAAAKAPAPAATSEPAAVAEPAPEPVADRPADAPVAEAPEPESAVAASTEAEPPVTSTGTDEEAPE